MNGFFVNFRIRNTTLLGDVVHVFDSFAIIKILRTFVPRQVDIRGMTVISGMVFQLRKLTNARNVIYIIIGPPLTVRQENISKKNGEFARNDDNHEEGAEFRDN